MKNKSIRKRIENILSRGTRIVSFSYNGKARNILVGANVVMQGQPAWGVQVNRAIRETAKSGRAYLVGIVNNEGGQRKIKCFALDRIVGLSV